jgi:hypothetical protein
VGAIKKAPSGVQVKRRKKVGTVSSQNKFAFLSAFLAALVLLLLLLLPSAGVLLPSSIIALLLAVASP